MPTAITGTTSFLYVPRTPTPKTIIKGRNYFFIKIHSAQAAYSGPVWSQADSVLVTSKINLNHPALNSAIYALQHTRSLEKKQAVQLGLARNIVDPVPAKMDKVSISFEFVLHRKNQLSALSKVINDGALQSALSLAPGMSLAAQILSSVSQKLIENFIPKGENTSLIQFDGDLNVTGNELKEGYYVILGSWDKANPLPSPDQQKKLVVQDGLLLIDDKPIDNLSFIILDLRWLPILTRDNSTAAWNIKLLEAEDIAEGFKTNPFADEMKVKDAWVKIGDILNEARTLLRADPSILEIEAKELLIATLENCKRTLSDNNFERGTGNKQTWRPDDTDMRALLGISPEEDTVKVANEYAEKVFTSRQILGE